ncbi:SGNH/GDSL hydrolase family protein [Paenibacillus koleovorans]|uniref:SGNH/GDSL hydrolase family protein n=1 Tax=Paenibacillus koleovorans TaxID=121608 RepID=UPI000FD7D2FF|nr:SGNH/GDSL hydrolase family protein [Paenibacillus koleovorans]
MNVNHKPDGIQFYNVEELEQIPGVPGLTLQRYPADVRERLGIDVYDMGRRSATMAAGCELRFVTESRQVRLYVSSPLTDGELVVYHGDYFHSMHTVKAGGVVGLSLQKHDMFLQVTEQSLRVGRFSPDVWRVVVSRASGGGTSIQLTFHHLDTFGYPVREPLPEEVPSVRWLAYGSSITQGGSAIHQHGTYVQQAARRLGVDVYNKGLSGSCYIEPQVADYLASLTNWDIATLELGVNMRGRFTTEQFRERAEYLVSTLLEKHPDKPIVLLTIFPNVATRFINEPNPVTLANEAFCEQLRDLQRTLGAPNLHLIEGSDILTDFSGLTADLVHPSDYGHMLMGQQLAERLRVILQEIN